MLFLFEHPEPLDKSTTKIVNLNALFVEQADGYPVVVNPRVFDYVFTNGEYASRFGGRLPPKIKFSGTIYDGHSVNIPGAKGEGTAIYDQKAELDKLISMINDNFVDVTLREGESEDTASQEGTYKIVSFNPRSSYSTGGKFLRIAWSLDLVKEYESTVAGTINLARSPAGALVEMKGTSTVLTFTASVLTGNGDLPYPLNIKVTSSGLNVTVSKSALYSATDSFTVTISSPYPSSATMSVWLEKGALRENEHSFDLFYEDSEE